ncbi:MAG: AAA family ATPase, partial [Candidatus Aureabacteria bacterium]|nr:AAA family ATPase [Candidatus Auribacterota bacterium]
MLKKIHLCFHHGLRVKGEKEICFSKQVNIIIGPNGSGKSTVLRSIYECGDCMRSEDSKTVYRFFDSELNNPHATEKKFTGYRGNVLKTRAVFSSHGEIMRSVLANFQFNSRDCLLV